MTNSSGIPEPLGPLLKVIGVVALLVVLLGVALWAAFRAPCSWYAGSRVTDVPLRCLRGLQP